MTSTQLIIYATMLALCAMPHWFLWRRVQTAELLAGRGLAVLGAWCLIMCAAPIMVQNAHRIAVVEVQRGLMFVVFNWAAYVYLFFFTSLALTVTLALVNLPTQVSKRGRWFDPTPRHESRVHLVIPIILLLYGYYEAAHPVVERIEIADARIPAGTRVRVAAFADMHIEMFGNVGRLDEIMRLVEEAKPDLLVTAGDLLDVFLDDPGPPMARMARIRPPLGKFAILGNHEYYVGVATVDEFMRGAGFDLLRGERRDVASFVTVVGFNDSARVASGSLSTASEAALLGEIPADRFVIVARHRPEAASATLDRFDLQVSGHTHGGQTVIHYWLTRLFEKLPPTGLSRLSSRSQLYLTRGAGTYGPPIRVFAPPEVTLIDLVPATR